MLQRIQTLYILIACALFSMIFYIDFADILIDKQFLYRFNIFGILTEEAESEIIVNTTPLIILSSVTLLAMIIDVFIFKNRVLQIRLLNITIFFLIGIYIMFGFYFYKLYTNLDLVVHYSFVLIIPLISIILLIIAKRYIKKDEELVKSVDRIR
ncbi:MAG: DUF4293 domain-containing protein [Marinilabiliales bacterium]